MKYEKFQTITVGELEEILKNFDKDMPVAMMVKEENEMRNLSYTEF